MISRTSKLLEIYDLDASEPLHFQKWPTLTIQRLHLVILFKSMMSVLVIFVNGAEQQNYNFHFGFTCQAILSNKAQKDYYLLLLFV